MKLTKIVEDLSILCLLFKETYLNIFQNFFDTYGLEQEITLRYVKELLCHKDIKTTLLYTQVVKKELRKIKSPIDYIDFLKNKDKIVKEDIPP